MRAGDIVWRLPKAWFRELETRQPSLLRISFEPLRGAGDVAVHTDRNTAAMVGVQKAIYLETFRAKRPLSVSSLHHRLKVYRTFALVALEEGKSLGDLDYADLARAVGLLNKVCRQGVPAVYSTLRSWKSQAKGAYPFFALPPSLEAQLANGEAPGFDPDRVRDDAAPTVTLGWQPLPDAFVATAGNIAISLVESVRPLLLDCLEDVGVFREAKGRMPVEREFRKILLKHRWPEGYAPSGYADFRKRCRQAQTATIFLLSLLLGCRSSEVLSLPRAAVRRTVVDGHEMHFLHGSTFKLSSNFGGDRRDWPVHELLGRTLADQDRYIELTEGPDYNHFWKQHLELFNGGKWLHDVDGQLEDFVQNFELEALLEGTRCHHHRFRKTTARLIVIALYGGPVILRRLFGHEHLAMTLRYILADSSIIDELRTLAEEEQRTIAQTYVANADQITGAGGRAMRETLAHAREVLDVIVPEGKRDQASYTAAELVEFLGDGPEGLAVKQILPGLLACFKPRDEAGLCCSAKELPNVARCSSDCKWQLMMPEFEEQAARNVEDALAHLSAAPDNPLTAAHYRHVVDYWLGRFPGLSERFPLHRDRTQTAFRASA